MASSPTRAPSTNQGKPYLDKNFPKIDFIKTATMISRPPHRLRGAAATAASGGRAARQEGCDPARGAGEESKHVGAGSSFCLLWAGLAHAEQVVVTVLATTDLHGNLYPIDYCTDRPANRGLAKIATLIRAAEAENPNHILIDCGDTIQGTPLEYVYQTSVRSGPR